LEKEENEKLLEDFPFVHNPAVFLRLLFEKKKRLNFFGSEKKMKRLVISAMLILFAAGYSTAGTCTTLDMPGSYWTRICGIDGSNLVGYYCNDTSFNWHGCIYNLDTQNWTTLDRPGTSYTNLNGISGDNIVGVASYNGFVYNTKNQTWTTLSSYAYGIDGSNVVGIGFVYNMDTQSLTNISKPGASYTYANGVSGSMVVGKYMISDIWHGFLYNIDTKIMTQLDKPNSWDTTIDGIDGSNLVGWYDQNGDHGFLYNMNTQTWTTIDIGARGTYIYGIDGNNLVGAYEDSAANYHGFIYTIPEPATLLLLGLGGLVLRRKR